MQMNGIHVTPVIKGSCLFAKHWNAIWQFCWRQQAQKNNPHLPQKSKSLGQEGEEGRVSWCVWVSFRLVLLKTCRQHAQPSAWNSAPAVQANSPPRLCFMQFYTLAPPVQSLLPSINQWALHPPLLHHLHHYILLSCFALSLPGCWKLLGEEQISQNRLQWKTQNFQPYIAGCGRSATHFLSALTALLVTLIWNRVKEILC